MGRAIRIGFLATFGLVVASLMTLQGAMPARAEKTYCSGFAASILQMERSPTKLPGWLELDRYLRYLYAEQCVLKPTRSAAREYWYRADGTPLGLEAGYTPPGWDATRIYRPEEGAFTTTPQIAAECARIVSMTPSVCAMLKGMEAACLKPVDSEQRTQCEAILEGRVPDLPEAADPLPPLATVLRSAPSAPRMTGEAMAADPGFQRMCAEAKSNFDTCSVRRTNMSSIGGPGTGGTGQAGAFYECQQLYNGVLAMCRSAHVIKSAVPAIAAPTTPAPPPKPGDSSGRSAPPPGAAKCPPGTTLNKDGYCLAANQTYCGGGMMCGDGMECRKNGKCFYANNCFPNEKPAAGGNCIPISDVDCGNGTSCPAGQSCTGRGTCHGGPPPTGPVCPNGNQAAAGNLCNPFTGGSYDPRRLKLCGTTLCNILAECGNNDCLSPYKQVAAPKPK